MGIAFPGVDREGPGRQTQGRYRLTEGAIGGPVEGAQLHQDAGPQCRHQPHRERGMLQPVRVGTCLQGSPGRSGGLTIDRTAHHYPPCPGSATRMASTSRPRRGHRAADFYPIEHCCQWDNRGFSFRVHFKLIGRAAVRLDLLRERRVYSAGLDIPKASPRLHLAGASRAKAPGQ